ncbi:hypothetical protein K458DRAFT_314296 [Lentithecium fluviatile CBS 122367]|uniref:F-box domain-containing protein n=1 Tax=Lentithecium fluviatile CBS 122367 TaxID=1168545 RepID=A0A6G1IMP4_9PLEO|nr:hypothetical protein K458DRAFT_314296 [Lentithecium fluviatile CBS 122367]
MDSSKPVYANYLPDELLLEILNYIPRDRESQSTIATFCAVSRQWYDVAIPTLYEAPYVTGHAYTLFVRTICPSVIPRIKKSELAGLVQQLDLSAIVHQGGKSTTARLLGRMKSSLELFVAPQASFAINCWASLSKCTRMKVLDLSLISEAISYQNLNQTLRQLPELERLYMPRCSSHYDSDILSKMVIWPARLHHLTLSGSVHGKFLNEMLRQPSTFPPTLHSMSMLHCPGLDYAGIKPLLENLAETLTTVELRDLPKIKQGRFNSILTWLPRLTKLTVAIDYIDQNFAHMPPTFSPARYRDAKPLQHLTLLSSGQSDSDPARAFSVGDLFDLIDMRFLGRLRYVVVAKSTGWNCANEGAELEALRDLLVWELDRENWEMGRWHYEGLAGVKKDMQFADWALNTAKGRGMRARLVVWDDRGAERERRWPELR